MSQKYATILSSLILIYLILARYFGNHILGNIVDKQVFFLARSLNLAIIFTGILLAISVNKERLYELNIDKISCYILLLSAGILGFNYLPYIFGVPIFGAMAILLFGFRKRLVHYSESALFSIGSVGMFFLVQAPVLLLHFISIGSSDDLYIYMKVEKALANINAHYFGVLFEEFLFRSLLWMMLKKIGTNDHLTILFQALLFWLAHFPSAFGDWYSFWISIPFASVTLGILVYRSKSIAASLASHLFYNFLVDLL